MLTKKVYNKKTSAVRLISGSLIGGIYSLTVFVKDIGFIKYIAPVGVLAFVFKFNNLTDFIRTVAVFYIVLFVFGGCFYAMSNSLFVLSTVVSYFVLWLLGGFYKKISVSSVVDVTLWINNKTTVLNGLVDTGNSLYDPYTRLPVMIVSEKCLDIDSFMPRLIPYKSVGSSGLLKVITPEKVVVDGNEIKCAVGVCDKELSDSFNAILNPVML